VAAKRGYGAPLPEAQIIAAVMTGDIPTAIIRLDSMLPGELARFRAQCQQVIDLIEVKLAQAETANPETLAVVEA
jgi:hypothetical protein